MKYLTSPNRVTNLCIYRCVRLFATPWTVTYQAPLSWDFAGNSTGVDCHFLLQRIFPTQRSNPGLPHCRQTLYHLSHQGSLILRQNDPQTGGFREPCWARTKSESYPPLEDNKRACRGRQCSADLVAPKSLFMVWSLWAWSTEQT